ncbi:MAG: hypothetical protein ACP5UR_06370 [Chloroflexus sp.]|uniref:hypothetical protein n=1 Tax=Chloroflexus sp. TaxID=1904827 RepID=UPI003D0F73E3
MQRLVLVLGLFVLLLAGCSSVTAPEPTPTGDVAYPYPVQAALTTVPPEAVYPGPSSPSSSQQLVLAFYIAEPVRATDTQLRGGGPSQAPIRVVNLSRDNLIIAEITIGEDGQFTVPLRDVTAGDTVAIVFNEQITSPYTREQVQPFSVQVLPSGELVMSSVIVSP